MQVKTSFKKTATLPSIKIPVAIQVRTLPSIKKKKIPVAIQVRTLPSIKIPVAIHGSSPEEASERDAYHPQKP